MFLETERLEIRDWTEADFESFAALMKDPEVMRFSLNGPLERSRALEAFHRRFIEHREKYGFAPLALILKKEQKIIGFAGLITQLIDGEEKIEMAYRLFPAYWGQGLAYEAVSKIYEHAFKEMKIESLISIIDPENKRSLRLAERLGMKLVKKSRYQHVDVYIYARSNS